MSGGKKGNKGKGGGGGGSGNPGKKPDQPKPAEGGDTQQFKFNFGEGGKPGFDFGGKEGSILPIIQKKLDTLIGQRSGYFESLPLPLQNRVKVLKVLHNKKADLDKEYKKRTFGSSSKV